MGFDYCLNEKAQAAFGSPFLFVCGELLHFGMTRMGLLGTKSNYA